MFASAWSITAALRRLPSCLTAAASTVLLAYSLCRGGVSGGLGAVGERWPMELSWAVWKRWVAWRVRATWVCVSQRLRRRLLLAHFEHRIRGVEDEHGPVYQRLWGVELRDDGL
jgi:hypothetical protein